MKWFYKWLNRKISDATSEVEESKAASNGLISRPGRLKVPERDDLATEPINFKMYKASGGWAIEFRQYDRKRDTVESSLYVVNDEEELGNSVSKIITMEALKR